MATRSKPALTPAQAEGLRHLPSVDELLMQPRLAELAARTDRNLVLEIARATLSEIRASILAQGNSGVAEGARILTASAGELEERIAVEVERILARSLVPVINATGVILHTNLGRGPL